MRIGSRVRLGRAEGTIEDLFNSAWSAIPGQGNTWTAAIRWDSGALSTWALSSLEEI